MISRTMMSVSQHLFHDSSTAAEACISVVEVIDEEYGLHVWPCSVALAEYVWQHRSRFFGVDVLELGAGTALAGILAAKIGAHVTLTDISEKTELSPDIIIGADVLYDAKDFDDLFATVAFMLYKKPEAVFITAYEHRSVHRLIELLLVKWKLKCSKLLDAHEILPEGKLSQIPNSVEIVEIQAGSFLSEIEHL